MINDVQFYGPFSLMKDRVAHVVNGDYPETVKQAMVGRRLEELFDHSRITGTKMGELRILDVKVHQNPDIRMGTHTIIAIVDSDPIALSKKENQ